MQVASSLYYELVKLFWKFGKICIMYTRNQIALLQMKLRMWNINQRQKYSRGMGSEY